MLQLLTALLAIAAMVLAFWLIILLPLINYRSKVRKRKPPMSPEVIRSAKAKVG